MKFNDFLRECRDRQVLKNLSIYIVSSWVLLQVIDLLAEAIGFSNRLVAWILIALLIGFPLYILLLWKLNLSGRQQQEATSSGSRNTKLWTFKRLYFLFLMGTGVICLAAASFIFTKNLSSQKPLPEASGQDKLAVLPFDNYTGSGEYDLIGNMTVDWLIHGITRNKLAQVISPEIIREYSAALQAKMVPIADNGWINEYLKPSRLITGEYYLKEGRLLFHTAIKNALTGATLISLDPVECDADNPLGCIESINQRILGYLVSGGEESLGLQPNPPRYEAYKLFQRAKSLGETDEEYMSTLESAIAADSSYFEPKAYRFMYYYNRADYPKADSLLISLKKNASLYDRQQNLLNFYEALLAGDQRGAYKYEQWEYNITPFHLETNSTMMLLSLQFINRPEGVDSIYREIDMGAMDMDDCLYCVERYKLKALSAIALDDFDEAIQILQPFTATSDPPILKKLMARALIRSGDFSASRVFLEKMQESLPKDEWADLAFFAATEYLLTDRQAEAEKYFGVVASAPAVPDEMKARALFHLKRYPSAEALLTPLFTADSLDFSIGALLALTYRNMGEISNSDQLVAAMLQQKAPYQYGNLYYALGQYYAYTGARDESIAMLKQAVSDGYWYETGAFRYDPLLKNVLDDPAFNQVMTFWH